MIIKNPMILDALEDWQSWIKELERSTPNAFQKMIDTYLTIYRAFKTMPKKSKIREVQRNKTSYAQFNSKYRSVYDNIFKYY